MDKSTAYQWFPETGETDEVCLGEALDLSGQFASFYYCKNAWSYSRILPGSWVLNHSVFGVMCMDPEIYDALQETPPVTLTSVEGLTHE